MSQSNLLRSRGRVAALTRSRTADDPEFVEAKRDLAADRLNLYIERVLSSAPPLTDEQVDRIVTILRGGAK